jgi:hypothetical protein
VKPFAAVECEGKHKKQTVAPDNMACMDQIRTTDDGEFIFEENVLAFCTRNYFPAVKKA